ncbi:PTS sugar transporter subunit IIA [Enterobacter cloacae subsp. cloacae]|nr:PTS sugar transporter subunit IIA [Enterobacter cloacae subsp. cloacae]
MNQQDTPLVTPRCISLDNDWNSKKRLMKGMTDNLFARRAMPLSAQAGSRLWAREAVFSTGFGFDFAIPHSKSEHIEQSTISVARLKAPVIWGDEEAQSSSC